MPGLGRHNHQSDKEVARVKIKKPRSRRVNAINIVHDKVSTEDNTEEIVNFNRESGNLDNTTRKQVNAISIKGV